MSAVAELGLDASGFMTGISYARNSLLLFNGAADIAAGKDPLPESKIKRAAVIITLGVAAITAAMAKGTAMAIQFGSSLVDLSYNEGLATDQAMALQLAVERYGISSASVAGATSKFNAATMDAAKGTGPLVGILQNAGIAMDDFVKMDVSTRMQTVAKAIKEIKHPTEQAQAAMAAFGSEGIKFNEAMQPGKINSAVAALGSQAKLMQENAGMFARISQILAQSGSIVSEIVAGAKSKLQGFFIGMASSLAPEILSILDSVSSGTTSISEAIKSFAPALAPLIDIVNTLINMDFAAIGQNIGKSIAVTFEQLKAFKFGDLFKPGSYAATREAATAKVEENKAINLERYKTPEAVAKEPMAAPIAAAAAVDISSSLSSLTKVGGAAGGMGGGIVQDQAAWQSVRIQESILDYTKQLLETVKGGTQDLGITPSGGGIILTA